MEPLVLNLALCAGSSLMLCFLFLFDIQRVNISANKWLGAFYLCLGCTFYRVFAYRMGLDQNYPLLIHLLELFTWATMPCFYYAIITFTNPEYSKWAGYIHFLPAFAFLLFSLRYLIPGFFGFTQQIPELPFVIKWMMRYFSTGQLIVYWYLSFRRLSAHKNYLLQIASSIENVDLSWLKNLMIVSLFMILLKFVPEKSAFGNFVPLFYLSGMVLLACYSLRQQPIYAVLLPQATPTVNNQESKEVWERLEAQQVEVLQARILKITTEKKLYLDPSLSLSALSNAVDIGPQDLSYVLNNGLKKNFYEFINELRVEAAKELLESDKIKTLDMLGIATHAGFNSKTTFNTTFKKLTGFTPTQYLKSRSQYIPSR